MIYENLTDNPCQCFCEYPVTALWRLSGKFVSVTQIPRYMEVIYRSTETLKKKAEDNPRTISEGQLQKLKESIQKNPDYFEARPIILSDRTGHLVIIAGNQRYDACVQRFWNQGGSYGAYPEPDRRA